MPVHKILYWYLHLYMSIHILKEVNRLAKSQDKYFHSQLLKLQYISVFLSSRNWELFACAKKKFLLQDMVHLLVEQMGGDISRSLTADVTHLIAGGVGSQKYLVSYWNFFHLELFILKCANNYFFNKIVWKWIGLLKMWKSLLLAMVCSQERYV